MLRLVLPSSFDGIKTVELSTNTNIERYHANLENRETRKKNIREVAQTQLLHQIHQINSTEWMGQINGTQYPQVSIRLYEICRGYRSCVARIGYTCSLVSMVLYVCVPSRACDCWCAQAKPINWSEHSLCCLSQFRTNLLVALYISKQTHYTIIANYEHFHFVSR